MTDVCIDLPVAPATSGKTTDADFWSCFFADRDLFFRMCVRWLGGNRHDAEDAISRGTLRALDYQRRHPGKIENFRPWMLRLLQNLCADVREAQDRLAELPGGDEEEEEFESTFVSPAVSPERAVYAHELRGALGDAVSSLPGWLHMVFLMRIVDDVPYPDICQHFRISPVNARQRIQQARRHLRSRLNRFT